MNINNKNTNNEIKIDKSNFLEAIEEDLNRQSEKLKLILFLLKKELYHYFSFF